MGCFSCFVSRKKDVEVEDSDHALPNNLDSENDRNDTNFGDSRPFDQAAGEKSPVKSFTYRELCTATGMFNDANWVGEGGFGKVFKGRLKTGEVVAVKQLNREGVQGSHEFIIEVLLLSYLHHPNLMNLKGYCTDGDEKLLVYEYMPKGSLERHLFDLTPDKVPLDWNTRLKIAVGTARGLWYLHDTANPPVIFRDLKPANILLDNEFNARLSDFGLAKLGPVGDHTHVSTRVMGTYGYCAPEYAMSGKLTVKCDVYSFGVLLLELITGRKAFDSNMTSGERTLVDWSRPFLKDWRKFVQLADPAMKGRYPMRCLHHAIAIAAMCIQDQPAFRPLIVDVLVALEFLASQPYHSEPGVFRHKSHFQPQPSPSHRDLSRF